MKRARIIGIIALLILPFVPGSPPVYAQQDKTCTADSQCLGPAAVCWTVSPGDGSGLRQCRNRFCTATTVTVVDSAGNPTGSTTLRKGQKARITLTSSSGVTDFIAGMYNLDNLYSTANPRGIYVPGSHLAQFAMPVLSQDAGDNPQLIFSSLNNPANTRTKTLEVPYDFFIVRDKGVSNAGTPFNRIASRVQINGFFGIQSTKQFSTPETQCVASLTIDTAGVECTSDAECSGGRKCSADYRCTSGSEITPSPATRSPAGSCPANSSCNTGNICGCDAGYNNCDNNWANGCEVQGRCPGGGVCTSGTQCQSGICNDRICTGVTEPTRVPAGGSCQDTVQCQSGYTCRSSRCFPVYCDANRSCPAGYNCKQGVCFPPQCNTAGMQCPEGYTCDATSKICQPAGSCRSDLPCAPGYYCDNDGICKASDGAGSCTNESECKANGQCINDQCFCKNGSYNCDRNWVNGCEATAPCQGSGTAKVTLKVKFNGIGVNVPPVKPSLRVKIGLANRYLTEPVYQTVDFVEAGRGDRNIMTYQGSADFTNIPFGDEYSIFVKGGHHLQKRVCDNGPTEVVDGRYYCTLGKIRIKEGENIFDFTKIYMLAGDLPVGNIQDGFIDSIDATVVRSNLGSKEQSILDVADLNLDGIVDAQDFRLIMSALEFKYDEEVTGLE